MSVESAHPLEGSTFRDQAIVLVTSWIGLVLGVIIVMSSTFSVLFSSIATEFGWQRSQLALAYSLFSLTSTLALPFIGRLVDLAGARRVVIGCVLSFAALTFLLQFVTDLWQFCAIFVALGVVSGGTSTLPYFKVLVRVFAARRGLALGIANSGTAVGTFLFPFIAYRLNTAIGWRNTYLVIGVGVAIVTIVVMLIGLHARDRDNPASPSSALQPRPATIVSFTLAEAMRTPQFWLIGGTFFIATTALVGYLIHVSPLLNDRGMAPAIAALGASIFGGAQLFGRLAAGFLLDKLPSSVVAAGLWVLATLAFVLLWAGVTGFPLLLCTALAGFAFGGEGDVLAYFVGRLFGPESFGRIYSVLLMISLLGGVAGPYLFGAGFDATGSYVTILGGATIAMLVAVVLILGVRSTNRRAMMRG